MEARSLQAGGPVLASAAVAPPAPPLPGGRGLWEVRFHGRGGQGTVIASIILAQAAFLEGRGVQAFPFFGVERRGAPVVAHTRVAEKPIRLACEVAAPDAIVVLDPSLAASLGRALTQGLRPGALALLNTRRAAAEFPELAAFRVATVDAAGIARRHKLGSPANPIVNTAMLGALARAGGTVRFPSLEQAIRDKSPGDPEANVAAATDARDAVVVP